MKKYIILLLLFPGLSFGKTIFNNAGTLDIRLLGGNASSSSFWDINNELQAQQEAELDGEMWDYSWEYSEYFYGVSLKYSFTDDIFIFTKMALGHYFLDEKWLTEETGIRRDRNSYSLFQPTATVIGAKYRVYNNGFYAVTSAELSIPPGFHHGIQNDPDYDFLSDGAFEGILAAEIGYVAEKGWFELGTAYNPRDEELSDQMIFALEGGVTTVETTRLGLTLNYIMSLDEFSQAVPYALEKTTLQEDILFATAFFEIDFDETVYFGLAYDVTLYGRNTASFGVLRLNIGAKFNLLN